MGGRNDTAERKIARIASRQNGAVARIQLLRAGVSVREIERRLESGALIPVYRGVYRVGHWAPSVEARYTAAVLACGEGAVLFGPAAGRLQRLLKGTPPPPSVLAPRRRSVPGVRTCRYRRLGRGEVIKVKNITVTSVPRTLVDLAAELNLDDLAHACHEAGVLYRTTPAHVKAILSQRPNARGAKRLRVVMEGDVHVTLSTLERAFLALLRREELPLPITNRVASGRRVDCRWPDYRLTVELDSYRFHNSRYSWEQDRRREREARHRGDEFRRYTFGDVLEDPAYMLRELRDLLTQAVAA